MVLCFLKMEPLLSKMLSHFEALLSYRINQSMILPLMSAKKLMVNLIKFADFSIASEIAFLLLA